ncbi:ABC transporter substrate-binding protein [Chthonobacter rhizosphaerae]|uniref:ABC transporter substrate-binding protein n=1 Tax=Chthonobacter rhizosphaerae TaxID=2735553 RepID=UPI0015EEB920|nr:extracellular solute-binding protein [Chthonobacter rhizosphaerae]
MTDTSDTVTGASGVTGGMAAPSRRGVLQGIGGLAAASTFGTFTIISRSARAAEPLRILCWPGYEEKSVIEEFEDIHKTKVEFKIYIGGEQMLQFYAQTPPGTFDAIISDAEYVQKLVAQKAVEAFPSAAIPELANYHPKFADFAPMRAGDGAIYGVATRFSFYGISYNKDYMSPEEAQDWSSLLLPKLTGKVGVFDWYLPNLGNASLAVMPNNPTPYDITSDQLAKVREWLLQLRPQVSMFGSAGQPIIQAMIAGDVYASPTGDLDIDLKLAGYDNFDSTIPKQGGIRWQEVATLCAGSTKKDLGLEWIKYMSTAKVQSNLVYTQAFKARAPNLKVVEHWNDDQKTLLHYVPDPADPSKLLVEDLIDRSVPRGLPAQQPEREWIDIFNEFKTA